MAKQRDSDFEEYDSDEEIEDSFEEEDSEFEGEDSESSEDQEEDSEDGQSEEDAELEAEVQRIQKNMQENDKLRRMTYAQSEKIRQMEAENQRLKNIAGQTFEDNIVHTEARLEEDLAKAKAEAAIAIKDSDPYATVDAQAKIAKITADMSNFERWKDQYQGSQEKEEGIQREQDSGPRLDEDRQSAIVDWTLAHSDLDVNSPYYNPQLTYIMAQAGNMIDQQLWQSGNQHLIGTSDYFDLFDRVVAEGRQEVYGGQQAQPARQVRPEVKGRGYNHPVTRGGSSSSRGEGSGTVRLTADEVDFARSIGVSPKAYLESKIQDMRGR